MAVVDSQAGRYTLRDKVHSQTVRIGRVSLSATSRKLENRGMHGVYSAQTFKSAACDSILK